VSAASLASEPFPSATVAVLRDGDGAPEFLLLRRNAALDFHGGAWVFPGGRIDAADRPTADATPVDRQADIAARRAAVRETREEAGLMLAEDSLVHFATWTTPPVRPKRFRTWFYAAALPADAADRVAVDGSEIQDHCWLGAADALAARERGELVLPPPTFVCLLWLAGYRSSAEALAELAKRPARVLTPKLLVVPDGACSLYEGDAGYDDEDLKREGPRHRLWMLADGWRYEESA
jgi:8-oxo-dGTP pyrophosphatase MutT (NUDIX family)